MARGTDINRLARILHSELRPEDWHKLMHFWPYYWHYYPYVPDHILEYLYVLEAEGLLDEFVATVCDVRPDLRVEIAHFALPPVFHRPPDRDAPSSSVDIIAIIAAIEAV